MPENLVADIGWAIALATGMAFLAKLARQPLILAYVACGIIFGPGVGLGLIEDEVNIRSIGEIGLVLLLFMIGLEIDLKRLLRLGRPVLLTGVGQVLLTALVALGFFLLLGFSMTEDRLDAVYLAAAASLSSTLIVVKLLYDKTELDTLAGRFTVGILVVQDIFAIVFLAVQPDLQNPDVLVLAGSVLKGAGLVAASFLASRYLLPHLFHWVARQPELVLLGAVAWCFVISGSADFLGLSLEMGALIAGVSISTFPYNHDIINRIVTLRDFFVTLFFVSLGLQIPSPDAQLIGYALAAAGLVILTRQLTIFPFLYFMRQGIRVSVLTSINLAQISEFSLVMVSLGAADGHIGEETASIVILAMILTSAFSPYMVQSSHRLYQWSETALTKVGVRDRFPVPPSATGAGEPSGKPGRKIVLLGFYREASSFLENMEFRHPELLEDLLVIDFNPDVHRELTRRGIHCFYGDVSRTSLLADVGIGQAQLIFATIPDTILAGTSNLSLVRQLRYLAPEAEIVATAETIPSALEMYDAGADFVLLPRMSAAESVLEVLEHSRIGTLPALRRQQLSSLEGRQEVIS